MRRERALEAACTPSAFFSASSNLQGAMCGGGGGERKAMEGWRWGFGQKVAGRRGHGDNLSLSMMMCIGWTIVGREMANMNGGEREGR